MTELSQSTDRSVLLSGCRVLLIDDEAIFQEGLEMVLENRLGLEVAGKARTEKEALAKAKELEADLILLDVHLGNENGIHIARRLLEKRPEEKIIMLSSDVDPLRIDEALMVGVMGYVFKKNLVEELKTAIETVLDGSRYLCSEGNDSLLKSYRRLRDPQAGPSLVGLSPREREVLRMLAEGLLTKEIADRLGVSVKSAETYRSRLMKKLQLFTVAELARFALREGLVD